MFLGSISRGAVESTLVNKTLITPGKFIVIVSHRARNYSRYVGSAPSVFRRYDCRSSALSNSRLTSGWRFASSASKYQDPDHYRTLGVSRHASSEEIKAAFYEQSKKHHPDVSTSDSALQDFLRIRASYDVLGDAIKKKEYDTNLKRQEVTLDENMFHEGIREHMRRSRKRSAAQDREEDFTDFTKGRHIFREAEEEYRKYYAKDAHKMHPVYHHYLIGYLINKERVMRIYRNHHRAFFPVFFLLFLYRMYANYHDYFDTRVTELEAHTAKSDADEDDYAKWMWTELSRRWTWKKNIDRLPDMLEQSRAEMEMERFGRYKEQNPE